MDPMQLWQQWLAAAQRAMQTNPAGATSGPGAAFADPWGVAAQWFQVPGAPGPGPGAGPATGALPNPLNPIELWQWWLTNLTTAMTGADPTAGSQEWLARWQELLRGGTGATSTSAATSPPAGAWQVFRQWYDAVSGPWAEAVDQLVSGPEFAGFLSQYLDTYLSGVIALRQSSERFAGALRLPTRDDIARVAGLVIALEEKVDRIEEAQEAAAERLAESAYEPLEPALASAIASLDARLSRVEAKLDRLITAMERATSAPSDSSAPNIPSAASINRDEHSITATPPTTSAASAASAAPASNGASPRTHKPTTTTRTRTRRTPATPRKPPAS